MYERTTDNNVCLEDKISSRKANSYAEENRRIDAKSSSFLAKVYGYMFVALLVTFVVAFGIGYLTLFSFKEAIEANDAEKLLVLLYTSIGVLIVGSIGVLITSIIISIASFSQRHSIAIPGIIYAIFMGILMSSVVMLVQEWILATAFGISALVFGVMFLISKLTRKINWFGTFLLGFLAGAGIIAAIFIPLYFLMEIFGMSIGAYFTALTVDAAVFILIFFTAFFDIWRIQRIADRGINNKNLALFCAFTLYSDFIAVLLRVIRILLIVASKKK